MKKNVSNKQKFLIIIILKHKSEKKAEESGKLERKNPADFAPTPRKITNEESPKYVCVWRKYMILITFFSEHKI